MAERQFGPYRLVRQIAVGGMAEIHLAKTRGIAGFEKFVALKMIHPNFAQDEQFIQMLIDEAKIAVQLQHVNIAQTFDLGRVGETYYITMEFVDGADLYKILRRGSEQDLDMPLDVCAYVAKEMATGLDYAHRKRGVDGTPLGIVHRDVSPQNVLISHAGEVKLVDFGIAKATMRARQTQVGVIKGKYYYMSPEQAWGDPLDHRSDIFSCGIVLYEMLTGQMLYLEEDLHKLLDMVRRADIAPPRTLRKDVPPQLERIVMHALAKQPNDRYQSAADLATDLERFLHTYSPVFTASKLSGHLRRAVGEPVPFIEPAAPAPRNPQQQTQPIAGRDQSPPGSAAEWRRGAIDRRELVQDRSEFSDENSVIFRLDEVARGKARARGEEESTAAELPRPQTPAKRAPTGPNPQVKRAPTGPNPTVPRASSQVPPASRSGGGPNPTLQPRARTEPPARSRVPTQPPPVPAPPKRPPTARPVVNDVAFQPTDLADVEEMTAITGPPGFDGGASRNEGPGLEYGDYEPTMIEQAPSEPEPELDEVPTITRDGMGVPLAQPVAFSGSETVPRPHNEIRSRVTARGAPAHPALSASTPTPAVSALRGAKSRRTPPGGVPAALPPPQNVLAQIVQSVPAEPMPTMQMRAASDGVPRAPIPDHASSNANTQPQGQVPPPPIPGPPGQIANMQTVPGQYVLPQPYQPPLAPAAPPTPLPGQAQLPPHLVQYGGYGMPPAAQAINPAYPYPYGQPQQPVSFTRQMQAAIELDELPQRYRIKDQQTRRIVMIVAVVALVIGAVGLTALFMRSGTEEAPSATLVIESMPPGAQVTVDGTALTEVTPARFPTVPGARHDIGVTMAHYKSWAQGVVVPSSGGDVKVVAVLAAQTGKLRINTVPGGAEIYINGELRGVTPKTLDGLDPATTTKVELRLKDFATEDRDLDWSTANSDTIDLDVKFRR